MPAQSKATLTCSCSIVQRALEEAIREENVEQLRQDAMEHMLESFAQGSIVMLYVDVVVNGHHLKAFVDSGAQMTIMSSQCAERTGIMRLVDRRYEVRPALTRLGLALILGCVSVWLAWVVMQLFLSSLSLIFLFFIFRCCVVAGNGGGCRLAENYWSGAYVSASDWG